MDPITPANFRAAFPAFANPMVYPDSEVEFYIALSTALMDVNQWGDLYNFGQYLFVAHNLALDAMSAAGSASGGVPGAIVGPVTSASVDKVSYGRADPTTAYAKEAGHWNLTTYGLRFYRLMWMVGAKPIQIGATVGETNAPVGAGWPGVIFPTTTP